jgi:Transglycosylase-like domain
MQRVSPSLVLLLFLVSLASASAAASPLTRHDRNVIRFFQHHPRLARTPAGGAALARVLPHVVEEMRTLQAQPPPSPYPPHHALWVCIHEHEASTWDAVNSNGHYGGLQMTWGWLGYVNGNPADLTEAQQEWAAEKAWAAYGYSLAFLYGQWYDYDGASGCGTTG